MLKDSLLFSRNRLINENILLLDAGCGRGTHSIFLKNLKNDLPGIILLDLNMPKMNGIEFLRVMKTDNSIKRIPVIVLTTSKEEQDKIDSFNLGVAGYMIKPVDYLQFVETMRTIDMYWTLSELPDE